MATAIGDLVVRLGMNSSPFHKGTQQAKSALGSLQSVMSSTAARVAAFGAGLIGIKKIFDGLSFGVKLAAEMEQAEIAFTQFLGSARKAQETLANLVEFAEKTPFELPEIRTAAQQLLAFGVNIKDLMPTLTRLGNVSAGIHQPLSEIADIYGRNLVQGRLFTKDIREFTGRGIPIVAELAKQFGVSEENIMDMVEAGKITKKEMVESFRAMSASGGKFAGLMDKQSQTLAGRWSTFRDTVNAALREVGFTLIETFNVKGILENMIGFAEAVKQNVEVLGLVFRNFGAIAELAVINLVQQAFNLLPMIEQPLAHVAAFFLSTWDGMQAFFGTWLESIKGGFMELKQFAIAIAQGIQAAWAALKAGEFRDIGSAFANAFVNTLAQQQNVEAKNAFVEFGKAFGETQKNVLESGLLKTGGLSAGLETRRQSLLAGIADTEFKRFAAKSAPADAAAAAGATAGAIDTHGSKRDRQFAGAMERGSSEAWSTIVSAWRGAQDKPTKGDKEIVKSLDKVKASIDRKPAETVVEIGP